MTDKRAVIHSRHVTNDTYGDVVCNVVMRNATFTSDALAGKHYENVTFMDCNFIGVDFRTAAMIHCVFMCCIGIIDAGHDNRGYHFFGVRGKSIGYRIRAGCRWFTLQEARLHWSDRGNDDALARVRLIDVGFRDL